MKNSKTNNELIVTSNISKLLNSSSNIIMLLVAIIMFVIGILAIGITVYFKVVINFAGEDCHFKFDNIPFNIISSIFILCFLYFTAKKILPLINSKILIVLSILFSLALGFFWIDYVKFKPVADQSLVIYCAECLIDNNLEPILNPGEYLNSNPHQLGFVTYIVAIFELFDTRSPLVLQKLNVIYSTINLVLLYLICKEIFKENLIQKIALLLIAFFSVYWTFFNTHVYGNIPGLMFALIAILFTLKYLNKPNFYKTIIIAISLTFAYLLKSNYQIFFISIIMILALHTIQNKKINSIISIVIIFITVFGCKSVLYKVIEKSTGYSLDTGVDMLAYVYMGIAEPVTLSPGWYTADVVNIYKEANFDKETSKDISKTLFYHRLGFMLGDLSYTFKYFSSKLQTTWLNPTFQVFWCSTPSTMLELSPEYNQYIAPQKLLISILTGTAYKIEQRILDIYQIITFIFAGVGLYFSYKETNFKKILLPLTFLGGFIFHIIWETKSIYVIQYFFIMLPFSAFGLYKLFNKIDNFLDNISETKESEPQTGAKILEFKRKEQ